MYTRLTLVYCVIFLLDTTGLEGRERRARVLSEEGPGYLEGLEVDGFLTTGHEDGVVFG